MKSNNPKREEHKQKAYEHTELMKQQYHQEIAYAIHHTHIYDEHFIYDKKEPHPCTIKVLNCMTSQAIFDVKHTNKTLCALNFASFKNPGGGFYRGTMAQEEALCHDSFLYNVLIEFVDDYYTENRLDLNHSLYYDRALYSKDILFFDELGNSYKTDILTCAAPNYREAKRHHITIEENNEILKKRIRYILDIASKENVDIFILGAWGCGVFGQDPLVVASCFKELLDDYDFEEVIFAVPRGMNDNYYNFNKIFLEENDL